MYLLFCLLFILHTESSYLSAARCILLLPRTRVLMLFCRTISLEFILSGREADDCVFTLLYFTLFYFTLTDENYGTRAGKTRPVCIRRRRHPFSLSLLLPSEVRFAKSASSRRILIIIIITIIVITTKCYYA